MQVPLLLVSCLSCAVRHVLHADLDAEQHGGHVRTLLPASLCRSIAETFCPADFVEMIHNKKGEREGWTVYGFTKMANIWMAKVGSCLLKSQCLLQYPVCAI